MNGNTLVNNEFYTISEDLLSMGIKMRTKTRKIKKNYLKQNTEIKFAILIGLVQLVIIMTCFVVVEWKERKKNTHKYFNIDVIVVNLKMTYT